MFGNMDAVVAEISKLKEAVNQNVHELKVLQHILSRLSVSVDTLTTKLGKPPVS